MASDIYYFNAIVDGEKLTISVCDLDCRHKHPVSSHFKIASDLAEYFEGGVIKSEKYDEFLGESITVPDDTPIIYTGGRCTGGYSWDANDKRTYYYSVFE